MRLNLFTAGLFLTLAGCNQAIETSSENTKEDKVFRADENRLEADVRYLADDLLEGREAGTRGYDLAARYVAERYRAIGLKPGGEEGTYYQSVPLRAIRAAAEFGGDITLTGVAAPNSFVGGVDYIVNSSSRDENVEIEAPLVFVGYGLVSEENNRDDYAGLDVEGKIVVYLTGAPKFLQSEERAHYGRDRAKVASERGAIGAMTLLTPTSEQRYSFARRVDRVAHRIGMNWLNENGEAYTTAPNILASATISLAGAEKLFANAPANWTEIAAAAESDAGEVQGFDLNMSAAIKSASSHEELSSPNVIGVLEGSDPSHRDEYVVLTAHLDHTGVKATEEPRR